MLEAALSLRLQLDAWQRRELARSSTPTHKAHGNHLPAALNAMSVSRWVCNVTFADVLMY